MGGIFGTERTAEMRINFSRRYQPFHRGKLGFELPLLIQKSIQLFNKFFALLRVISCADKLVITYFYSETEYTAPLTEDTEALSERLTRGETALEVLLPRIETYYKENKIKSDNLGEVEISYHEFIGAGDNAQK